MAILFTVSCADAADIASQYLKLDHTMIQGIKKFPACSDQVFHVDIKPQYCSENIFPIIIKCTIQHDIHRVDLWIELAKHLIKNGISTPQPIPLLNQDGMHPYIIKHRHNYCFCYQYMPGIPIDTVEHTPSFLKHLGHTIATIHTTLCNNRFKHSASKWKDSPWCVCSTKNTIDQIANLSEVLDDDQEKLDIVAHYLALFEDISVLFDTMPKLCILGDINT
eukprot:333379_1